jgi:chorismate mutase/prephenate dehydratase
MENLDVYRAQIDEIDKQLTKLIEQRLEVVLKVGQYKREHNLPVFNKEREAEVIIKNTSKLNNKHFSFAIEEIYKSIIEASKKLEEE